MVTSEALTQPAVRTVSPTPARAGYPGEAPLRALRPTRWLARLLDATVRMSCFLLLRGVAIEKDLPVDPSGATSAGDTFSGIKVFKKILLQKEVDQVLAAWPRNYWCFRPGRRLRDDAGF